MTTPSSTSQSVFSEPRGMNTSSYGPTTADGSFMNITGRSGVAAPVSAAWSE